MTDITKEAITTAVTLANTTSKQAVDLASLATKTATELAAKTAETTRIMTETIAIVGNNVEWMKKSLSTIEGKLNEMDKAFVTAAQHAEVIKSIDDHETRINGLESNNTKNTVLLVVGSGILSFLVGLLIWHLFQS